MSQLSTPTKREGAWLWLIKIVAGALILVLLGVHFVVNHLVAPGGLLSYAAIVHYYQVPFVAVMEITFLTLVISHALIGVRSILLDLTPSAQLLRWIDIALILLGSAGILYGVWLVLVIISHGTA